MVCLIYFDRFKLLRITKFSRKQLCSLCCLELTSKRWVVDVELVAHTRSRLNVSVATTLGAADAEAIHNHFIFPD